MKKLLIIISLFTLISCTHQDQNIRLDFSFDEKKSNIGNGVGINVAVVDNRSETKFLGSKEFCDAQQISIISEQNLAEIVKKEIDNQLLRKGFRQGDDKLVEIQIQQLKYEAQCGIILGKSKADILVTVTVTTPRVGGKITKNFNISLDNKHFIIPLAGTDAKTINNLIKEVVENILDDDMILRN